MNKHNSLPDNVSYIGTTQTKSGSIKSCYSVTCLICGKPRNITRQDHAKKLSKQPCKTCSNKSNHPQGEEYGIRVSWFNKFKNSARYRFLDWELTIEDVATLLAQQSGRCALSGLWLVTRGTFKEITASIDRIDSSKGYTMGNVQLVHKDINMMKQSFEQSYFVSLCQKVAGNNK